MFYYLIFNIIKWKIGDFSRSDFSCSVSSRSEFSRSVTLVVRSLVVQSH